MSYLLDTCVLSEYIKQQPTPQVITWLDEQDEERLFISAISIGEINKGIVKLRDADPARADKLKTWLDTLEQRFDARILTLDATAMRVWGELYGNREKAGSSLPLMDSLIMACASCHELTIVTRNIADFPDFPQLFNPWEAGAAPPGIHGDSR